MVTRHVTTYVCEFKRTVIVAVHCHACLHSNMGINTTPPPLLTYSLPQCIEKLEQLFQDSERSTVVLWKL